jgi:hypothetical protein
VHDDAPRLAGVAVDLVDLEGDLVGEGEPGELPTGAVRTRSVSPSTA